MSELTTRGTTPPLSPISGSSIEQRGYKKVRWTERGFNTLIESSRLFPVMSVFSLQMKETSVAFTCSGDYGPKWTPKAVAAIFREFSLLNDQNEKWNVLGASKKGKSRSSMANPL